VNTSETNNRYENEGFMRATRLREPSVEESFLDLVQKGDFKMKDTINNKDRVKW
jgi:hypothetical protein